MLTREDYDRTWVFYNLDIYWNASSSDRVPYQSKTLLGISFIFSHKMYNIWFCIISPFLILTFLGDIWFSLYLVGAICTLSLIYNHLSRSAFHIHSLIPFTFSPLFVPRRSFIFYFHLLNTELYLTAPTLGLLHNLVRECLLLTARNSLRSFNNRGSFMYIYKSSDVNIPFSYRSMNRGNPFLILRRGCKLVGGSF